MTLRRLILIVAWLVASQTPAHAQSVPAALTADRIIYTTGYQTLRATGHVEIIYQGTILQAAELHYDAQTNRITAQGPLRLTHGEDVVIVADYAELSADFQDGVLTGARMVLNQQMQLSAVEINRSQGRYSQLYKAAASSCTVSLAHPTPLWQIRAKRIIHDEEKRRLFFENAQLRIGKVPVAYIPRMRVPDPSVKRASGFLVPGIANSSAYGTNVTAPYFLTFGDYADVTFAPKIYTSGTVTLQFDARKRFHNGKLDISGAYTHDTIKAFPNRGYLFASGALAFKNGYKGSMNLQFVSDGTYFLDHGIGEQERLESFVRLEKTTDKSYFGADILGFRPLRSVIAPQTIPFLMNGISYSRQISSDFAGGQLRFDARQDGLYRASATDIVGRDVARFSATLDWQREWFTRSGVVFGAEAQLNADYYAINQDSTFASPVSRVAPVAAVSLRWPLAKSTSRGTQVIEPILQVVMAPDTVTATPNDDSVLLDFESSNLFSLNRFSGRDVMEAGLRANIGVNYSRRAAMGWTLDASIGRVLRARDLGQFAATSGLSGGASSYVSSLALGLPSRLRLEQRSVFDTAFNVSKSETAVKFHAEKLDVTASYMWLTAGAAANLVNRSEWNVKTGLDLARNWRTESLFRYDLASATASDAGMSLTYRNDCIKVDLSLSRSFVSSSNISASTNIGFQVTLEGFGSRDSSTAGNRKCSDF